MVEAETKFELKRELPDLELKALGNRLIGFQRRFERIGQQLRLLTDLEGVKRWAEQHHGPNQALTDALGDRYPLVIFHGDVGTGKTATAEAAAQALCEAIDSEGFLLKLSTRVRGVGHVGEMSNLIGDAFAEAIMLAGKKRFVAMVIDEGDALAFNRGAERAHHEDRVGVNTLIQAIDDARALKGRLFIILATNRFSALDPAILRRASLFEHFERPNEQERRELLLADLEGADIGHEVVEDLVLATGPHDGAPGFTFSDIQTRLLPAAIGRAYPTRALTAEDLLATLAELEPTPVMHDQ
jgi:SpoVK/Ycf46/Vps4 family AAA+-type ATPase